MFHSRRLARAVIFALSFSCLSFELAEAASPTEVSPIAARAMLNPLIGDWNVEKTSYLGGEQAGEQLTSHREFIANSLYVNESTTGLMSGRDYLRMGMIGYNPKTNQYEWTAFDSIDQTTNDFVGGQASTVHGEFKLFGLAGARKTWTRLKIESHDKHVFEVYVENKHGKDVLVDRMVFTRIKKALF